MKLRPVLWGGGAVLTAVALGALTYWPAPPVEKGGGMAPVAMSPMAVPVVQPEAEPVAKARELVVSQAPQMPTVAAPAPSLSKQFAQWKAGSPREQYGAYRLVADCINVAIYATTLARFGMSYPAQPEKCGDLTPGDKAEAQALLITAARSGVHGAFRDIVLDQQERGPMAKATGVYLPESSPATKALIDEALAASLATADPFALTVASARLRNGSQEDKAQALVYHLAMLEVRGVEIPATKVKVPSLEDKVAADLIKQLPPEVVRDAVSKAAVLAKKGLS